MSERDTRTASLVVCVYQNEGSIPELCRRLASVQAKLREGGVELEVLFVEDGSSDGSYQALVAHLEQLENARILRLTRNFGAVQAFKAGLAHVRGECFMFLGADLQDDPALLLELVERWLRGSPFVVFERAQRRDPLSSRLFAGIYYRLMNWLVFKNFPRGGFDVFLLDCRFLPVLLSGERNANVQALAYWIGVEPEVLSYVRESREHGRSTWTLAKKAKYLVDTFSAFTLAPLRLVSLVGIALAVLSFSYGILVVVSQVVGGSPVRGWSSLMAVISLLLGTIILMLSIIGEYLWRVLDQVRPRAEYVVGSVVESERFDRQRFRERAGPAQLQ